MFLQRLKEKILALTTVHDLTPDQHEQLNQAVSGMTPADRSSLTTAAASGSSHPVLDLLRSFVTDPTKQAAVLKFVATIVSLFSGTPTAT